MGCVYKATNLVNLKAYVGLTGGTAEKRWKRHVKDATSAQIKYAIHAAIRKYGADSFKITILFETEDYEELNEKEKEMIDSHGTLYPNGYNLQTGGRSHKKSSLTLQRMREASLGKKQSAETKARRSAKLIGIPQTKEHIDLRTKTRQKPVLELTTGLRFDSVKLAAEYFQIKAKGISKNLHGRSNHYFGKKFKFVEKVKL